MCAYQGVRNVCFSEWRALLSCNTRFEIGPFALLPTGCVIMTKNDICVPLFHTWYRCIVVITTAQFHSTKLKFRFRARLNPLAVCQRSAMMRISVDSGPSWK